MAISFAGSAQLVPTVGDWTHPVPRVAPTATMVNITFVSVPDGDDSFSLNPGTGNWVVVNSSSWMLGADPATTIYTLVATGLGASNDAEVTFGQLGYPNFNTVAYEDAALTYTVTPIRKWQSTASLDLAIGPMPMSSALNWLIMCCSSFPNYGDYSAPSASGATTRLLSQSITGNQRSVVADAAPGTGGSSSVYTFTPWTFSGESEYRTVGVGVVLRDPAAPIPSSNYFNLNDWI